MSNILRTILDCCHYAMTALKDFSHRVPGTVATQSLVVGSLVGFLAFQLMKKRYRLPPGPRPLPLLGNLLSMLGDEPLYMTLAHWAKEKYGPVIAIYFGPVLSVTLNDLETINEALLVKGNDFAGRPRLHSLHTFREGSKDIAFADYSPTWKLHRKIAMQAIRHYMTGSHMEKVVHQFLTMVADKMAAESGPFDPHPYNSILMFDIIDCICFGDVKKLDDPSIQRLIYIFDEAAAETGNGFFEDIIPFLRYWPTRKFRRVRRLNGELIDYVKENVEKHRQTFSPDHVRDITDCILKAQMEAAREESAEVMAMFTDVHVRQTITDLYGAGVDTSRLTLTWTLLFLAGHPEIQKKVQAEIDLATGPGGRMPGMGDRHKLQYTEAMLYESMRLGTVVPTALPHRTMCDTTVGGYDVPKDTMVLVNLWAVTHDPTLWDQPDKFRPERFLDSNGQVKTPKPDGWLPFSAGRRVCLGESVARPELVLILACLLQRFTISLPPGQHYNPVYHTSGVISIAPVPYKVVVTPR